MKAPCAHEAEPTVQDRENAQKRLEIAERQNGQYDECLRWALQLFGRGWEDDAGEKRHFMVADGQAAEWESCEAAFGKMLLEPHATNGFLVSCSAQAVTVRPAELALMLCHAPRSVEKLASLRVTREKKGERELKKWQEENPLFAIAGLRLGDGD
jgi:hypothetical protein